MGTLGLSCQGSVVVFSNRAITAYFLASNAISVTELQKTNLDGLEINLMGEYLPNLDRIQNVIPTVLAHHPCS